MLQKMKDNIIDQRIMKERRVIESIFFGCSVFILNPNLHSNICFTEDLFPYLNVLSTYIIASFRTALDLTTQTCRYESNDAL